MKLLSNLFPLDSINLDARLIRTLLDATESVLDGATLSLTSIGRVSGARNQQVEKHTIKRIDRLLGNPAVYNQKARFYQIVAHHFAQEKPLISVDWSTVYNYNFVLLRASLAIKGRAVTIYEEVHPEGKMNNHQVHCHFLKNLSKILPKSTQPILCSDAGFKVPWFKEIEKLGWFWLARTRGTVKCHQNDNLGWQYVHTRHQQATGKAKELTNFKLSKSHQLSCRAVINAKPVKKGRKNLNRKGQSTLDRMNKVYAKSAKEPWILVSNLPSSDYPAHQLVNFYSRRMTIEESFRDTKDEYYGLGIMRSRTRSCQRLEIILLIAMLAQLALYVIGKAGELKGYHRYFQANTVENRRVLSYAYLGLRLRQHHRFKMTQQELVNALHLLIQEGEI